jgi:hypothetical protein
MVRVFGETYYWSHHSCYWSLAHYSHSARKKK